MDQATQFILKLVLAAFVTLVVSISGCTVHQDRVIATMVKEGANPVAARCAISGTDGRQVLCGEAARK